jgi:hypothetical protein
LGESEWIADSLGAAAEPSGLADFGLWQLMHVCVAGI